MPLSAKMPAIVQAVLDMILGLRHREISLESHDEDRIHVQFAVLRIEAQSINGRLLRQNIILALHLQADISLGILVELISMVYGNQMTCILW